MCIGPLKKVCHWGPLTAIAIIKVVSFATIQCNSQWWPPLLSMGGLINSTLFLSFTSLTLFNFLMLIYDGPGYLPLEWYPEDKNTKYLQFCNFCQGFKAPRSHHCKKCGRCVLKMDHHCPWINNCVGHKNHANFTFFIFFAVCGCFQSSIILSCSLYRAIHHGYYLHYGDGSEPLIFLGLFNFIVCVFALGLSIGVVLAVGALLYFQLRAIIRNRTGIEDWILEKAKIRRLIAKDHGEEIEPFVYPYDLGFKNNLKEVLNWECTPIGDGIKWKIREHPSCDEFALTREQMEQKAEKRQRAKAYFVKRPYSGFWCPLEFGIRVLFSSPITDESRMPLCVGENIVVTRWRRHWLFGERQSGPVGTDKKGWFPRCCVVEVTGEKGDLSEREKKER